jgi:hypothetical protein
MIEQMNKMSQPDPQQQKQEEQVKQMAVQAELRVKNADATLKEAQAQKATVEAQLAPEEAKARILSALSNNLNEDNEGADFERRAKIAELMLKERDIDSNEKIAAMQMESKKAEKANDSSYVEAASKLMQ